MIRSTPEGSLVFKGACCVLLYSVDLEGTYGSSNWDEQMDELCTALHPAPVILSKKSRNSNRYLWCLRAYFDSVAVFGCVLVFFPLFFEGVED